jgi:EmrB/QacA subfamily drug resistance transporter
MSDTRMSDARRTARSAPAGWTLALAAIGTFLTALDIVVVATALPTLRTHLHASLADLEWTINAYNLVLACFMLTGAALGDRFGRKRLYVTGVTLFTAASAACALSTTNGELIGFRALQGLGAAIIMPLTITMVAEVMPVAKRAMAIGVLGGVAGLGVAAGPVIGGVVLEGISWEWIFWINVPVGAAVALFSALRLHESRGPRPYLDFPGLILAGAAMFAVVWAAVRAPSIGWGSAEVVGMLVSGAFLAVLFLLWERRTATPMLPLAYFRKPAFAGANFAGFVMWVSMIGSLVMITDLFQIGMGYSPEKSGIRILPWMALPIVFAPLGGALATRVGNRSVLLVGLILQGAGLLWLAATAKQGVSYPALLPPLIVSGIGMSFNFPTISNAVVDSVPFGEVGMANGANKATTELGSVFGVAIMSAVFAASGSFASPHLFVNGFKPAMYAAGAIALVGLLGAVVLPSRKSAQPSAGAPSAQQQPITERAAA